MEHIPVLLEETIKALNPRPNENFVDCTFGRGGHSRILLEKTAPKGIVVGLDWDADSLENYKQKNQVPERLILENLNYADICKSNAVKRIIPVDGILYDLGMSSWHIEESQKGFSFLKDEPLDMRYCRGDSKTAANIINNESEKELERIFSEYGQDHAARKIAKTIVSARLRKRIDTAGSLESIISKIAIPGKKNSMLARIFQSLRIAVNCELENLEKGLSQGFEIMASGGRMAVITFHSLEDRIVKQKFREWANGGNARLLLEKPLAPEEEEIKNNPRARSAKLRAIQKI